MRFDRFVYPELRYSDCGTTHGHDVDAVGFPAVSGKQVCLVSISDSAAAVFELPIQRIRELSRLFP